MLARENGANELITAAHAPASLDDFAAVTKFMFTVCTGLGISPEDQAFFVDRLLVLLTSCDERRFGQWEKQSWWEFVDAEHRSPGFRRFLADGLTRMLVAAQAQEISARTGGYILLQLIFDLSRAGGHADRLLDGPTSEVWIDPWVAHLRGAGRRPADRQRRRRDRLRSRTDRRGDRRPPRHARDGDRRPLRRGDARRAAAPAAQPAAGRGRAAPGGDAPAAHALDERGHVLPAPRRADPGRAHDLQRLRLGADLDLAASVLAAHRLRRPRRRARRRHPLGRRVRLGAPVATHGQGGLEVQRRRDQGRGVGAAQGPPQRPGARRPRGRQPRERLPRRGHHLPQPERAPRTPSRCSSTPPARGPIGPRR